MLALRRTPFIGSTSHHRDLIAAFVGAVGLISLWAMVGRSILPGVPLGVVITGGIAFTAIRGSLFVARMRGLSVLWSLLVLVWCAFLFGAAEVSDGRFVQFGKQIPIRFAVWSFAALPLWASTEFLVPSGAWQEATKWTMVPLGACVWLVATVASARLAMYAPDVGGGPLPPPIWIAIGLVAVMPVVIGITLAQRTWTGTAVAGRDQ